MIRENSRFKIVRTKGYNYNFDKKTGYFERWGKTVDDDPDYSPIGPEIVDLECTTICNGPASESGGGPCKFCYKSNTKNGVNMSFETFKTVFHNLPRTITQIAFGVDANLTSNPDIWKMFDYCRANDYNKVVPNVTVANITTETANRLVAVTGAVAVSRYVNKDWCYDSVERLVSAGLKQCNIHCMIAEENYDAAVETIRDYHVDPRLKGMNAIVFLSLKQTGRGVKFTPLAFDRFKSLIDLCLELDVKFGFDSCGAQKFIQAVEGHENYEAFKVCAEPCESTCFSLYVNVEGKYFPCSFSEGHGEWVDGIDLTKVNDFNSDVWYNERTLKFRDNLISGRDGKNCRSCPLFEI